MGCLTENESRLCYRRPPTLSIPLPSRNGFSLWILLEFLGKRLSSSRRFLSPNNGFVYTKSGLSKPCASLVWKEPEVKSSVLIDEVERRNEVSALWFVVAAARKKNARLVPIPVPFETKVLNWDNNSAAHNYNRGLQSVLTGAIFVLEAMRVTLVL